MIFHEECHQSEEAVNSNNHYLHQHLVFLLAGSSLQKH